MSSKLILNLDRAADRVVAGARGSREELLEAMERRLAQSGALEALGAAREPVVAAAADEEGAVVLSAEDVTALEKPDFAQMLSFAVWMIDYHRKKMVEADEKHRAEVQEDWRKREARDEAATAAYRDLVHLRQTMEGALHKRVTESILGIVGATPEEPLALLRTLESAVSRLRSGQVDLPEFRVAGLVQDWGVLTASLEAHFDALRGAIDAVNEEVEAARSRRRAKEKAVQEYRDSAVGWTNVVRGMLIAAGLRELAGELPATSPRRQGLTLADDSPAEDDTPIVDVPPVPDAPDLPDLPAEDVPFPANEPAAEAESA